MRLVERPRRKSGMDTSMGFRRASSCFSRFVLDAGLYLIN